MIGTPVVVRVERDTEARVWFVAASNLPGLNAEAATMRELAFKLPALVLDLAEEGVTVEEAGLRL
jgi:hypothetical protein